MKCNYGDSASPLNQAIAAITIDEVWRELELPGQPANRCHSPFRDDQNPSFAIYANGRRWYDHGTGEGGDIIDFIATARNIDRSKACRWLINLFKRQPRPASASPVVQPTEFRERRLDDPATLPVLPNLRLGTPEEMEVLSRQRAISVRALRLASAKGHLHFTELQGYPAWLVTDSKRCNAQARRLDGGLWSSGSKVLGFQNNCGRWPIGIEEAAGLDRIMLVEGTPDLLAAYHFLIQEERYAVFAPVCITGSAAGIHQEALPVFRGKTVRIMAHNDPAGQEAAQRWSSRLSGVAHRIDVFQFTGLVRTDGQTVKDLNDLCLVDPVCADPRLTAVTKF